MMTIHRLNALVAKALIASVLAAPSLAPAADDIRLIRQYSFDNPGAAGWNTLPLAIAQRGMPFDVRNQTDPNVAQFADLADAYVWVGEFNVEAVQVLKGDFDGNGVTDLALLNRYTNVQRTMPIAYGNQDGSVRIVNEPAGSFADYALDNYASEAVTGDFNGDGKTDVALLRQYPGWTTAPVLLSQKHGSFVDVNWDLGPFAGWATETQFISGIGWTKPQVITGDFNGDKLTDIALVRECGHWTTIPVAYAKPGGGFRIENHSASAFAQSCGQVVAGDFNGDGKTDLAAFSQGTMIVATATGSGFTTATPPVGSTFSQRLGGGARILTGKFDAGPTTDIALVDANQNWGSIMIAFGNAGSSGSVQFTVREMQVPDFASWATQGALPLVGDFDGNGQSDIALISRAGIPGGAYWTTIPIAYSYMKDFPSVPVTCTKTFCTNPIPAYSLPAFIVENQSAPGFADWAKQSNVRIVTGEFGR